MSKWGESPFGKRKQVYIDITFWCQYENLKQHVNGHNPIISVAYKGNIIYNYMASKAGLFVDIYHARSLKKKEKKKPREPSEDD